MSELIFADDMTLVKDRGKTTDDKQENYYTKPKSKKTREISLDGKQIEQVEHLPVLGHKYGGQRENGKGNKLKNV